MRSLALVLIAVMLAAGTCSAPRSSERNEAPSGREAQDETATLSAARDTCFTQQAIDRFRSYRAQLDSSAAYYEVPARRMDSLRTRLEASPQANDSRPEALLRALQREGISLEHAYFRGYATSCSAPGSQVGTDVIVPAQMTIQVRDTTRIPAGFQRVSEPRFSCPYRIVRFTPANCS